MTANSQLLTTLEDELFGLHICPTCGQAKPVNIMATVNGDTVRNHYTVQLVDRRTMQVDGKRISMIEETEPVVIFVVK